jgi:outer membrane protein assembly factor BamE (lipoprotein component of BamABCDE complex)
MKFASVRLVPVALAAVLLAGCATTRAHKGVVLDQQLVGTIQPGVDNKASVEKLLGRPSFVGQFTPNDWYYFSRDTNQVAFRNPRVSKQTVLLVRFDQGGNVSSLQRSGKELVLGLDPSRRVTPTLGRKKGFLDQLFGQIGSVGSAGPMGQNPGQ